MIDVVNVESFWDGPIGLFPCVPVKITALTLSATVIANMPERVMPSVEYHEWQWSYSLAQLEVSCSKHLVDGLACNSKSTRHLSKAVALLVEFIHRICFSVLARSSHMPILPDRLSVVN